MIGTTFKLAFDGTAVSRGMASIAGKLGTMGKAIGRGALERVGHQMTDLMGRIVGAIPEAIKETTDFAGQTNDLSKATNTSAESLILLQEAMRLGGAEVDPLRMLSNLADALYEADREAGDAQDSLHKLGMMSYAFKGQSLEDAFIAIADAIGKMPKDTELGKINDILQPLFGTKISMKMVAMFREFRENLVQAGNNTKGLRNQIGGVVGELDRMGDALGRFEILKKEIGAIALGSFAKTFGGGSVDAFFDKLNPEKLQGFFDGLFNGIKQFMNMLEDGQLMKSLSDMFKNIGRMIGEGIKESVGNFKFGLPSFGGKDTAMTFSQGERTIALLSDIRERSGVSALA